MRVNFFKHFARFSENTNTYIKSNASSVFLKVFWYLEQNLSKKFVHSLKILPKFCQHFPRIFTRFSQKFHQNFLLIFHYSLQIPKNFLKTFLNGKILACLIIISIISFIYTFYTLPLEFVPFASFCHYSFWLKISIKGFKISILKYFLK